MAVRRCPRCHSYRVSRSRRRNLLESLLLPLVFLRPFRCRSCDHRYYGYLFSHRSYARREPQKDPTLPADGKSGAPN